jgi:hypothetical protein
LNDIALQKSSAASSSNFTNQAPPKKKSKISSRNTKNSKSQQQPVASNQSVALVIPSTVHTKPQQLVVPQPIQPLIHDDKEGHLIYYSGQVIDSRCE